MCVRICPNLSLLKWFAGTKTNNIIIFGTCYSFLNDTFRLQEEQPPQSMRTLERCLHCLAKVKHLVSFFFFGFSLDWKTLHVCCTVTFMKYTVWCAISLEGERYRLHRMGSIKTFFWAAELTVVYIWSFGIWCNHRDKKVELLHTLSTEFKFPLFWMRIKKIHFYIKTTSQPSPPTPKPSSDLLNIFWVLIKIGRYAYLFSS